MKRIAFGRIFWLCVVLSSCFFAIEVLLQVTNIPPLDDTAYHGDLIMRINNAYFKPDPLVLWVRADAEFTLDEMVEVLEGGEE